MVNFKFNKDNDDLLFTIAELEPPIGSDLKLISDNSAASITISNDTIDISGNLHITGTRYTPTPGSRVIKFKTNDFENSSVKDLSAIGYIDASGYKIEKQFRNTQSIASIGFKVNYILSKNANEFISFRVLRDISSVENSTNFSPFPVYETGNIGSERAGTIKTIYNGTFIDNPIYKQDDYITYKLQYKRHNLNLNLSNSIKLKLIKSFDFRNAYYEDSSLQADGSYVIKFIDASDGSTSDLSCQLVVDPSNEFPPILGMNDGYKFDKFSKIETNTFLKGGTNHRYALEAVIDFQSNDKLISIEQNGSEIFNINVNASLKIIIVGKDVGSADNTYKHIIINNEPNDSGTNDTKIYIDGTLVTTASTHDIDNTNSIKIIFYRVENSLNAKIKYLKFYKNSLTSDEITEVYEKYIQGNSINNPYGILGDDKGDCVFVQEIRK